MEIYIEYAFLENFLFDSVLLVLALHASQASIRWKRVLLAGGFGGGFALLFPFLVLPYVWSQILKLSVGACLCLLAYPPMKSKKDRGRYATTLAFFYTFSFGFGGALLAFSSEVYERVPAYVVVICFAALASGACFLIRKLREKGKVDRFLRECALYNGKNKVRAKGFIDSGNLARKNGLPVCFLSLDLFYDLFGTEILREDSRQVCDEMQIQTLGGTKTLLLLQGEIEILNEEKLRRQRVYFSPSRNIVGREYRILLSVDCLDGKEGE